jgi:hypothetical protein
VARAFVRKAGRLDFADEGDGQGNRLGAFVSLGRADFTRMGGGVMGSFQFTQSFLDITGDLKDSRGKKGSCSLCQISRIRFKDQRDQVLLIKLWNGPGDCSIATGCIYDGGFRKTG